MPGALAAASAVDVSVAIVRHSRVMWPRGAVAPDRVYTLPGRKDTGARD